MLVGRDIQNQGANSILGTLRHELPQCRDYGRVHWSKPSQIRKKKSFDFLNRNKAALEVVANLRLIFQHSGIARFHRFILQPAKLRGEGDPGRDHHDRHTGDEFNERGGGMPYLDSSAGKNHRLAPSRAAAQRYSDISRKRGRRISVLEVGMHGDTLDDHFRIVAAQNGAIAAYVTSDGELFE